MFKRRTILGLTAAGGLLSAATGCRVGGSKGNDGRAPADDSDLSTNFSRMTISSDLKIAAFNTTLPPFNRACVLELETGVITAFDTQSKRDIVEWVSMSLDGAKLVFAAQEGRMPFTALWVVDRHTAEATRISWQVRRSATSPIFFGDRYLIYTRDVRTKFFEQDSTYIDSFLLGFSLFYFDLLEGIEHPLMPDVTFVEPVRLWPVGDKVVMQGGYALAVEESDSPDGWMVKLEEGGSEANKVLTEASLLDIQDLGDGRLELVGQPEIIYVSSAFRNGLKAISQDGSALLVRTNVSHPFGADGKIIEDRGPGVGRDIGHFMCQTREKNFICDSGIDPALEDGFGYFAVSDRFEYVIAFYSADRSTGSIILKIQRPDQLQPDTVTLRAADANVRREIRVTREVSL